MNRTTRAYVIPLMAFMVFLPLNEIIAIRNPESPWWRQAPELWIYPIQVILCLGLLWYYRSRYSFVAPKRSAIAWAAIIGVVTGVLVYAVFSFKLYGVFGISPDEGLGATLASVHYIHYMFVTLIASIGMALLSNLIVFGRKAELTIGNSSAAPAA